MNEPFNPYEAFKDFYENPVIKSIKTNKKWSVSDKDKMPIDICALMYQNQLKGAKYTDETCLVDLDTLCNVLPTATNNAYFLDALIDGFVVLDIEPKCPDDIKNKLLNLDYLYGEVSMSGKGLHLIFPLPDCISEYPIAQKKLVLKEKHGYYEILLNHWVTFTRKAFAPSLGSDDFVPIFRELAKEQKEIAEAKEVEISELEPSDIPFKDDIISLLVKQKYKKSLEDFNDDVSTYEFAYVGFLHYKLKQILNVSRIKKAHSYTDNEKAWLLYETASQVIPHRAKHDEKRNKLPWLLFIAENVIAKDCAPKKKGKE